MKMIKIDTCNNCPYIEKNDGRGYCDPFIICDKFHIMLNDWDGPEDFEYMIKIHPDCRLDKYKEVI